MRSLQNIAKVVLERRGRMTHVVLPADLQSKLGPDGMAEALRRRWVEADYDSGALRVNSNLGVVTEVERYANSKCEVCGEEKCKCDPDSDGKTAKQEAQAPVQNASRDYAMHHSDRLHEFAAPGSGQPDPEQAPAAAPAAPAPAATPTVPTEPRNPNDQDSEHAVGESVMVAEDGKQYTAVVKSKESDGTYTLSFGAQRPPVQRRYRKEELSRAAKPQ